MAEYPNSFFLEIIRSVHSLYDFQATKENLFFLFCLLHHIERNQKRNRTGYPLIDFQGSIIQSESAEDKQDFPKGNADKQTMVLNLLPQVSLLGWDLFHSKFFYWRNSGWGPLVTMQTLSFPYRNWYICTMNRYFPVWIQKSVVWLLLGSL